MNAEYPSMASLRGDISEELQQFERNVCAAMENMSAMAMGSVQKKFIGMDAKEEGTPTD